MTPDHYLLRMLYSLGVPMEDLGVGKPVAARDSRAIFRIFAAALGRVSRHSHADVDGAHALRGDRRRHGSSPPTALILYMIRSRSGSPIPSHRPRALFDRFGIEVLATTDPALSDLSQHDQDRRLRLDWAVIPTFRPDDLINPARPGQAQAMRGSPR
jgi:glucuronate isomerase